jgi:hypothetical protein
VRLYRQCVVDTHAIERGARGVSQTAQFEIQEAIVQHPEPPDRGECYADLLNDCEILKPSIRAFVREWEWIVFIV